MIKVTINLGLGNNPFTFEQLDAKLRNEFPNEFIPARTVSVFDGNPEETLVCEFKTNKWAFIHQYLTNLCSVAAQESIAYCLHNSDGSILDGNLAFNWSYTGEEYPFDRRFFRLISEC